MMAHASTSGSSEESKLSADQLKRMEENRQRALAKRKGGAQAASPTTSKNGKPMQQRSLFSFFGAKPDAPKQTPSAAPSAAAAAAPRAEKKTLPASSGPPALAAAAPAPAAPVPPPSSKATAATKRTRRVVDSDSDSDSLDGQGKEDAATGGPRKSSRASASERAKKRVRQAAAESDSDESEFVVDSDDEAAAEAEEEEDEEFIAAILDMDGAADDDNDEEGEEAEEEEEDGASRKRRAPKSSASSDAKRSKLASFAATTTTTTTTTATTATTATETKVTPSPSPAQSRLSSFSSASKSPSPRMPSFGSLMSPQHTPGRSKMLSPAQAAAASSSTSPKDNRYDWLLNIRDADKRIPSDPEYNPRSLFVPDHAWSKFTPFENQYWGIKKDHWDTLVFFKKGKFYELYEKDALIGQKEFDLKLTDRVNMCMVGVPEMSFPMWASKFIGLGYKVARVDEVESGLAKTMREKQEKTPQQKKEKIIGRELATVLTVGTLTGDMVVEDAATYCMSIKEDIASRRIGVCFADSGTGSFYVTHIEDDASLSQFETLIVQVRPRELILERGHTSTTLRHIIKTCLSEPTVNTLNVGNATNEFWDAPHTQNAIDSAQYFKDNQWPEALVSVREKSEVLSAVGGMFSYLRSLLKDRELISQGSFHVYDAVQEGSSLILDGQTLINLEVLENSVDGSTAGTLIGMLNRCVWAPGKRLFRQWICHPLRRREEILQRQEAIGFLMGSGGGLLTRTTTLLQRLPDLERLVSRIHAGSCKLKDFLLTLEAFHELYKFVDEIQIELHELADNSVLKRLLLVGTGSSAFPDLSGHLEFFDNAFDHDLAKKDNSFVPYPGIEAEYDSAQEAVQRLEQSLASHLHDERRRLGCAKMEYKHMGKERYQLEVPVGVRVPDGYEMKSGTAKVKRYWTPLIRETIQPLAEAQLTLASLSTQLLGRILKRFSEQHLEWTRAVRSLAVLDVLCGLTVASQEMDEPKCCPEIVEKTEDEPAFCEISQLRHPCVVASNGFVPNDVKLGNGSPEMMLLTGPNMGGKSTLLRQVCIAIVLSQLGCYVPARECRLTAADRIFTRIGASDNIIAGQSTFMCELTETSTILRHATRDSVVILDELGRGTSTFDGYSIAYAVLRHLADKTMCRGLFSTHYHMLTSEYADHPHVARTHMACEVNPGKRDVTMLYTLTGGVCPKSYGMNVACMAGVPAQIVDRAEEKAYALEMGTNQQNDRLIECHSIVRSILSGSDSNQIRALISRAKKL